MTAKKMLQFSSELSDHLEEKIRQNGYTVEKKKMFGHEVFFTNGYMFSGANVDGIFVHVGKTRKESALAKDPDVAPFEPMEGMVMKEYLLLKPPVYSDDRRLKGWLDISYAYLTALPPKIKPKKKS